MAAKRTRLADLQHRAAHTGLDVATWSPGDGVTRYRFFRHTAAGADYFGDDGIYTALGLAEANTFLAGHARGSGQYRRGRAGTNSRDASAFLRAERARAARRASRRRGTMR